MVLSVMPGSLCGSRAPAIDQGTRSLFRNSSPGPVCMPKPDMCVIQTNQSIEDGFPPWWLSLGSNGIALLKSVEKLRLKPYNDQTGKDITAWVAGATIGYGHLIAKSEWKMYEKGISEKDADELFNTDIAPFVDCVRNTISVNLQQHQFDALVIFAFNIGASGFKGSSVVKLINDPKTKTNYATLKDAWKAWNKSQGKENKGLINRRAAEWNIYDSAIYKTW